MTTFALVHGAWHGAWCWEQVTPLLEQAGHRVIAPDLPSDDSTAATFNAYADVVCAQLGESADVEDVVVVGHSLGGPTAALVAARHPARHLIYLCGMIPAPGLSLADQFQNQPELASADWNSGLHAPDAEGRMAWADFELARRLFYADCPDDVAAAAFRRLRLQSFLPFTAPFPRPELPSVASTYVVCAEDRMLNPDWSRRAAADIGAEIVELPGGHSPLLSRPAGVAAILLGAA